MDEEQLRLYRALSRAPFPKSYVGKVFLTAFLGTHVPLLAQLVYFVCCCRFALQRYAVVLGLGLIGCLVQYRGCRGSLLILTEPR